MSPVAARNYDPHDRPNFQEWVRVKTDEVLVAPELPASAPPPFNKEVPRGFSTVMLRLAVGIGGAIVFALLLSVLRFASREEPKRPPPVTVYSSLVRNWQFDESLIRENNITYSPGHPIKMRFELVTKPGEPTPTKENLSVSEVQNSLRFQVTNLNRSPNDSSIYRVEVMATVPSDMKPLTLDSRLKIRFNGRVDEKSTSFARHTEEERKPDPKQNKKDPEQVKYVTVPAKDRPEKSPAKSTTKQQKPTTTKGGSPNDKKPGEKKPSQSGSKRNQEQLQEWQMQQDPRAARKGADAVLHSDGNTGAPFKHPPKRPGGGDR